MKKSLIFLLLAVLLLTGCRRESAPTADTAAAPSSGETASTPAAQAQRSPHPLEEETGGILRVWESPAEDVYGAACMGDDLLLFSGYDWTTLTLLRGDTMEVAAQAEVPTGIFAEEASVCRRISRASPWSLRIAVLSITAPTARSG